MSKQVISTGTAANDGTGDTLRGAAIKINSNFTELYESAQSAFGKANTAWDLANAAFTYANSSTALITQELSSNVEFIAAINSSQNTTISTVTALATNAYGQANTGTNTAISGFTQANAAYTFANTVSNTTTSSYNTANSAWQRANASFERANNSLNVQNGGTLSGSLNLGLNAVVFDTGNIDVGSDALAIQANQNKTITLGTSILDGFEETLHSWTFGANGNLIFPDNSIQTTAYPTESYIKANNSGSFANGAFTKANDAYTLANSAFAYANTLISDTFVDPWGRNKANDAYSLANSAFAYANTLISDTLVDPWAREQSNLAFEAANTATANITFTDAVMSLTDGTTETIINITPSGPVAGWAYLQLPTNDTANTSNTRLHNDAGTIEFGTGDFSTGGSNTHNWYLNSDGTMSFPDGTVQSSAFTGLGDLVIYGGAITTDGASSIYIVPNGEGYAYVNVPNDASAANGAATVIGNGRSDGGGVQIASYNNTWQFKPDGTVQFPTLTVPISDNANPSGTGQTLKFTDASQQAIIYGPPSDATYNNAERVIIQGAPGYTDTAGEGGDVYLWAGPGGSANGSGGDIKVRAGAGQGSGTGGYLNFQAGDSNTGTGGYINIESGSGAFGGDITMYARNGGDIGITTVDAGQIGLNVEGDSWYFSPGGVMGFPNNRLKVGSNFAIQTANTIPNSVSTWEGGGGWNEMEYINLATTGGTGSGLTVDVAAGGGGYISINEITINTPGSGYTNGDVITIENENNLTGTFIIGVPQIVWYFGTDGSLIFPDATVQTTAFTGKLTGPDTANVAVNLNGTVSLTTHDDEDNIASWTYDAVGNIILPAEAGLVTTDSVTIGYYDIEGQIAVGALAAFYSTTANNAVVEITARNDISHTNKVQIISDGATGEDYVNIELYDGGQTYGTMSWKFHKSGTLESAVGIAPTTSVGVAGDKRGMIIHTATHMYFCTADYDSTTDIWRRMEWNVSDTW